MSDSPRLEIALKQLEFSRRYSLSLIADIPDSEWFRMPAEGTTHVAWQVAHLAMAEYGLCLFRIRGRQEEDLQLMTSDFRKQFSKGSIPNPDPAQNPTPAEIREVQSRVRERVLAELSTKTDTELDTPVDEPHAVFNTKIGAIYFCAAHEMLHAGQIGLLRRLFGKKPIR